MDLLPIRPVEFKRALNTGQIGWKFTEITFVCLPVHSMAAWLKALDLNGFTPNSTGQIGCKSIEIEAITLPVKGFRSQWIYTQFDWLSAFNRQCNLHDLHPIQL